MIAKQVKDKMKTKKQYLPVIKLWENGNQLERALYNGQLLLQKGQLVECCKPNKGEKNYSVFVEAKPWHIHCIHGGNTGQALRRFKSFVKMDKAIQVRKKILRSTKQGEQLELAFNMTNKEKIHEEVEELIFAIGDLTAEFEVSSNKKNVAFLKDWKHRLYNFGAEIEDKILLLED